MNFRGKRKFFTRINEEIVNIIEKYCTNTITVCPVYNDIGLYDTSSITSDVLRYRLKFLAVNHNVILILPGYDDAEYSFHGAVTEFGCVLLRQQYILLFFKPSVPSSGLRYYIK